MSASLQKRTCEHLPRYVRLVPKADIREAGFDGSFRLPNSNSDSLNIGQLPCLIEECLLRAIKTKPRPPILPRWGIYPIGLLTGGCLRANVYIHGAISILAKALVE